MPSRRPRPWPRRAASRRASRRSAPGSRGPASWTSRNGYGEAAQLRGTIYGGPHAEEAQSLRQLAAHCRERDDLEQALEYMDRSCAAYSSSLRAGEGADVIAEPATRLPPLSVARHASLPRIEPETPP